MLETRIGSSPGYEAEVDRAVSSPPLSTVLLLPTLPIPGQIPTGMGPPKVSAPEHVPAMLLESQALELDPGRDSTIDQQVGAAHEARFPARQPDHRVGDLLRLAHPPHGVILQLLLEQLRHVSLGLSPEALGDVDVSGAHGICPDAVRGQGVRELRDVVDQGGLQGAVGPRRGEVDVPARDGADGDYAALGLLQVREGGVDKGVGTHDVGLVGRVPALPGVCDREGGDVGHDDVDAAAVRHACLDPLGDLIGVANVHGVALSSFGTIGHGQVFLGLGDIGGSP